jgi:MOSC domain-containing protein
MGTLKSIYRYPIKGLSAEELSSVDLRVDDCIAFDRCYAIANGHREFDVSAPKHMPKTKFLMLMRHEKLAALETRFETETHNLTLLRNGKQVSKGCLLQPVGRKIIEQFFSAYLDEQLLGAPHIVSSPDHSFSDVAEKCVSIINLATIRDLERILGEEIHPLRFRANLYIDGIEPWAEFDWVDRDILVEDTAILRCFKRIQRCAAVNVNPVTAQRDHSIPARLSRALNHEDLGIYAMVTGNSCIRPGATIKVAG